MTRLGLIVITCIAYLTINAVTSPASPIAKAQIQVVTDTVIDTRAAGWMWHGMSEYDDPDLHGGVGYAGPTGSFGAYTFQGRQVSVYAMRGPSVTVDGKRHRIGSLRVKIDGVETACVDLGDAKQSGGYQVYTSADMDDKLHVVELVADRGWAVVDYLRLGSVTRTDTPTVGQQAPLLGGRMIVNRHSGTAVRGAGTGEHVTAVTVDKSDAAESWIIDSAGEGVWSIRDAKTNLALTTQSTSQWVVSSEYTGSLNQLWRIVPVSDRFYAIVSASTGNVLNVFDCSSYSGAWLNQNANANVDCQQWSIVPSMDGQ